MTIQDHDIIFYYSDSNRDKTPYRCNNHGMGVLLPNKGNGRYRIMIAFSISVTTNISYKEKS